MSMDYEGILYYRHIQVFRVYNNLAPGYLIELFQMREGRLDNTLSNLRSVANKNYVLPPAKCNFI